MGDRFDSRVEARGFAWLSASALALSLHPACVTTAAPANPLETASKVASNVPSFATALGKTRDGFSLDAEGFASRGMIASRAGDHSKLATLLPSHASAPMRLGAGNVSSLRFAFSLDNAASSEGVLDEGRVYYRDVFPAVDEVVTSSPFAAEAFFLLKDASAPHTFSFRTSLPSSVKSADLRADGLWFRDDAKNMVLHVPRPAAVDAAGKTYAATLGWDEETRTMSVALDPGKHLAYPVLLDPAFETNVWLELTTPSGFQIPSLTYDEQRQRMLMFSLNKTWLLSGNNWTEWQAPRGQETPSGRYQMSVVYDRARASIVMFGGNSTSGNAIFGDTWRWDGSSWTHLSPVQSPSARAAAASAYDADAGVVVLFGGATAPQSFVNDTWVWDGANWSQKTPATKPAARAGAAFGYDPKTKRTMVFGGYDAAQVYGDLWAWDGASWSLVPQPGGQPQARRNAAMAYDAARGKLVLFGGADEQGIQIFKDTWTWDGQRWSQQTGTLSPPALRSHAMAYDAVKQRVVLFGGGTDSGGNDDTWSWDGTTWRLEHGQRVPSRKVGAQLVSNPSRAEVLMFGAESDPDPAWSWNGATWTPRKYSSNPDHRVGFAMTWDAARQEAIMFGGVTAQSDEFLGDTYAYVNGLWVLRRPAKAPPARAYHRIAYDPVRRKVLLTGGLGSAGSLTDTWTWDGTTWTEEKPATQPPERQGFGMAACGNDVLTFGGAKDLALARETWAWNGSNWRRATGIGPEPKEGSILVADQSGCLLIQAAKMWRWSNNAWNELLAPVDVKFPAGEAILGAAFDPVSQKVVIGGDQATYVGDATEGFAPFSNGELASGGDVAWDGTKFVRFASQKSGELCAFTYEFSVGDDRWTLNANQIVFPGNDVHSTFDSTRNVALFVGNPSQTSEIRTWTWDGNVMVDSAGDTPQRYETTLSFDVARGKGVLFGGRTEASTLTADTWLWNGASWTQSSPVKSPSARTNGAMTYDAARGQVVLFGGRAGSTALRDTWTWDGTNWTEKTPRTSPPPRSKHALSYAPGSRTVILYAGLGEASALGDTWSWDGNDWSPITTRVAPPPRVQPGFAYHDASKRTLMFGGDPQSFVGDASTAWVFYSRGGSCGGDSDCASGYCVDGVCCDTRACGTCETCAGSNPGVCTVVVNQEDRDTCALADRVKCNNEGKCAPAEGAACKSSSDCGSGSCVDGICCDTACDRPCESCKASEKGSGKDDGICGPAKAGTNPKSRCGGDATCSTAGVCSTQKRDFCEDDRYLRTESGTRKDCAPYKCSVACLKRCSSVSDCLFPSVCSPAGVCEDPKAQLDDAACSVHGSGGADADGRFALLSGGIALLTWMKRRHRRSA